MSSGDEATEKWRGVVYAIVVVLLFAVFVVVSRAGLSTSLKLQDIAALRFGIGAFLLSPIIVKHGFSQIGSGQAMLLATMGGLGFALLAYAGFALAPSSHGGVLIHGTLALTTALLLSFFGLSSAKKGSGLGFTLIAIGVVAVVWDGTTEPGSWTLVGDVCLLAASFCWSGYGLYVKHLGISAVQAAAIVAATSALIFLPLYLVLPGKMLWTVEWQDLLIQAVFQGVLIGAGSVFVYTKAVVLLDPEQVSLFTAAVPFLAVAGGFIFLNELPGSAALTGVALVTTGMLTAFRARPS